MRLLPLIGLAAPLLLAACQQPDMPPVADTLRPSDPPASLDNVRALVRANPSEAVRVLSARPSSDPALVNDLGVALDVLGKHRQAQAAYHEALLMQPGMRSATNNLALSLALANVGSGNR